MKKREQNVRCMMYDVRFDKTGTGIKTKRLAAYILSFTVCSLHFSVASAQKANKSIRQGNEAYRKADFSAAIKDYTKAIGADAKNAIAEFNMANAWQHSNDAAKASQAYDDVVRNAADADLQSKAYYNKGLSQLQQKNLAGAIDAFKNSLRLAPSDNETRENLQKALEEMRRQQKQQPQQQNQPPPKDQPKKQKPQQMMNQQMMEQKFKELQEQEKQLQKELQKQKTNQPDPEKDW